MNVAVGQFRTDGLADIVVGTGTGFSTVRVFDATAHTLYGVLAELPSLDSSALRPEEMDPTLRRLFSEQSLGTLTFQERKFIYTAYQQALLALRKNITPAGFSACSLADNEVTGTDVNYRSVWARDGAITIASTIGLDDLEIRKAQ